MSKSIVITVPTLKAGGMERAAINFANSFIEKGFKVYIFTLSSDVVFYNNIEGINIIHGKSEKDNKVYTILSLFRLRKLVTSLKPTFVLSLSGKMSVYVLIFLTFSKTIVIPFHRGNPYKNYGWFNNLLNQLFFPFTKIFAVQTKEAGVYFKNKFRLRKVVLIPNPIRLLNIKPEYSSKKIVTVTRLVRGKGLFELIEIFKQINKLDWKYYIVGDGYLKDELQAFICKFNLENNIFLVGFQTDVDTYLTGSSIFAFASESEGFPNSLLEAMCGGLACISYNCPTGPSEMIEDGSNGFLINLYDKDEYILKLKLLMNNIDLRTKFGTEAKKLNLIHKPTRIINNFLNNI